MRVLCIIREARGHRSSVTHGDSILNTFTFVILFQVWSLGTNGPHPIKYYILEIILGVIMT